MLGNEHTSEIKHFCLFVKGQLYISFMKGWIYFQVLVYAQHVVIIVWTVMASFENSQGDVINFGLFKFQAHVDPLFKNTCWCLVFHFLKIISFLF